MIAIGYMALIFSAICGIISAVGAKAEQSKPVRNVDYRSLYRELAPKEL